MSGIVTVSQDKPCDLFQVLMAKPTCRDGVTEEAVRRIRKWVDLEDKHRRKEERARVTLGELSLPIVRFHPG